MPVSGHGLCSEFADSGGASQAGSVWTSNLPTALFALPTAAVALIDQVTIANLFHLWLSLHWTAIDFVNTRNKQLFCAEWDFYEYYNDGVKRFSRVLVWYQRPWEMETQSRAHKRAGTGWSHRAEAGTWDLTAAKIHLYSLIQFLENCKKLILGIEKIAKKQFLTCTENSISSNLDATGSCRKMRRV